MLTASRQKNTLILSGSLFPTYVFLFVVFYFLLSFVGLIHVYTYNELLEDEGCAIGTLFCHGQTEEGADSFFYNPLQFQFLVLLPLVFSIPLILFDFSIQRGPPKS